ncbi:MAG: tetratricopeptide repeat protein [Candidatus Helarchaeota archaeon]
MDWLSDVKQGKYQGIQQAGFLYSYGKQYPEYIELTIHELMEKLNDDDLKIRINAYWMISKISEDFKHNHYLIPIIPILAFGIRQKNEKIISYSLQTLYNLSNNMIKKIIYLNNDLLENFGSYSKKNQIFTLKLLQKFSEFQRIIPNNEFFLKYLENKKLSNYLIEILIHKKSYKTILPILLNNLQYENLQSSIFSFIERACEVYPFKIILALKKTLSTFDPFIRQNSLLIIQYVKNNLKIHLLLPEILRLIKSKIQSISRIALFFLYDIHNQILKEFIFFKDILINLRKSGDSVVKTVINSILIDTASYDIDLIKNIKQKMIKQLISQTKSNNIRIKTIAILGLSRIYTWSENEDLIEQSIKKALNLCLGLIREYPISEYNYELNYKIGKLNFYLKNFNDAKSYFEKANKMSTDFYKVYQNKIFLILTNFILHLPKTSLELRKQLIDEFKKTKLNRNMKYEIQTWNNIFEDLYHFKINNAIEKYEHFVLHTIYNNKYEINHCNTIKNTFELVSKL